MTFIVGLIVGASAGACFGVLLMGKLLLGKITDLEGQICVLSIALREAGHEPH
ncbi:MULTISPECIES: hypothetical protein [unclassified Bradyrhizobium]|uniref:hypothetical protein n=1 Tax=unclassified Bradyrhizobium TaxID=2631580 RepID=UPI002916A806|nr:MULTISPECIES: hypothetical protein [unclassified Bradyrhizobium]